MDSSKSQNPFEPEATEEDTVPEFDEARWRRVGASDEKVEELRELYDSYDDDQKVEETSRMHSTPDSELAAEVGGSAAAAPAGDEVVTGDAAAELEAQRAASQSTGQAVGEVTETETGDGRADAPGTPDETHERAVPDSDGGLKTVEDEVQEPGATQEVVVPESAKSAKDVEDWVGDDPAKARAAHAAELGRAKSKQRKGLLDHLAKVSSGKTE